LAQPAAPASYACTGVQAIAATPADAINILLDLICFPNGLLLSTSTRIHEIHLNDARADWVPSKWSDEILLPAGNKVDLTLFDVRVSRGQFGRSSEKFEHGTNEKSQLPKAIVPLSRDEKIFAQLGISELERESGCQGVIIRCSVIVVDSRLVRAALGATLVKKGLIFAAAVFGIATTAHA
jgi:hypothetical protein